MFHREKRRTQSGLPRESASESSGLLMALEAPRPGISREYCGTGLLEAHHRAGSVSSQLPAPEPGATPCLFLSPSAGVACCAYRSGPEDRGLPQVWLLQRLSRPPGFWGSPSIFSTGVCWAHAQVSHHSGHAHVSHHSGHAQVSHRELC